MKSTQSSIRKIIFILILCASPAIYLGLIAQDRFQSVSHFSVVVEESSNAEASVGLLNLVGAVTRRSPSASLIPPTYYLSSRMSLHSLNTTRLHPKILFFVLNQARKKKTASNTTEKRYSQNLMTIPD